MVLPKHWYQNDSQLEAQTATDMSKKYFYEPVETYRHLFRKEKNYHSIGLSKFNQQ
jgi:hypothetical protein